MISSKILYFENFSITTSEMGFYEIDIFTDGEFGFKELEELKKAQVEMGSHKLPVLVMCGQYAYSESEFLKYLAKNENNPFSKADAFVIHSIAQKILANFYIKIFIPERPTKFFKEKEEAVNWLKQFI
jgi:hypothetical protein